MTKIAKIVLLTFGLIPSLGFARDSWVKGGDDPAGGQVVMYCTTDATYPQKGFCFMFSCQRGFTPEWHVVMMRDHYPSPAFASFMFDDHEFPLESHGMGFFKEIGQGRYSLDLASSPVEVSDFIEQLKKSEILGIPLGHMFGGNDTQNIPTSGAIELIEAATANCYPN